MSDTTTASSGGLRQFSRPFWVINGIELLERGAFYTMNAVYIVHMISRWGVPPAQWGLIASYLFLLLYVVPLFAAPLAEKFGYRKSLVASFTLLVAGYGTLAFAPTLTIFMVGITVLGVGAGTFKPIAAAIVSQTTTEGQRNYGFIVYYAAINIGSFVVQLAVGLAGLVYGIADNALAVPAFVVATLLSGANFILVLTTYRNAAPPRSDVSVFRSFKALGAVFKDGWFLVLILIYSGFWFMYAITLSAVGPYMLDFGRMPPTFNVLLLQAINPGIIMIVTFFMGGLSSRVPSLVLMSIGITIFSAGFLVIGFSALPALFLGGVMIYSFGEVLTHPAYLSYVSKIAPPDKVSVYLGAGFLPVGIGIVVGNALGGGLYGSVALAGSPALYWAIMACVGFATVGAIVLYNYFLTRSRRPVDAAPAPRRAFLTGPVAALAAILLIPVIIGAATLAGTTDPGLDEASVEPPVGAIFATTGTTAAGAASDATLTMAANATGSAMFHLTWEDEAPAAGATNAPDTFRVVVLLPNGTEIASEETANAAGSPGEIHLSVPAMPGLYRVAVECVEAGGSSVVVGPLGLPAGGQADAGNEWALDVSYE